MMKEKIMLLGGGGHCKSVIDVIELEDRYEIAGIIVNDMPKGSKILGYEVIGGDEDLPKLREKFSNALITVGHIRSNLVRVKLFEFLKELDYNIPTIISPLSYVSKHATLGEGTVVMHHALINASAKVGSNCIINTKALIEHDAVVEDHTHISTGAIINGGTKVKENSFVGSGAVTKEYSEISGFIKAGSVAK